MNNNIIGINYQSQVDKLTGEMKSVQKTPGEAQDSFKQALNEAITKVNDAQIQSNEMTEQLAKGNVEDLHEVMITAEKASVTLKTTIEIRNKALEAYQEIMRMQV